MGLHGPVLFWQQALKKSLDERLAFTPLARCYELTQRDKLNNLAKTGPFPNRENLP